MFNPRPLIRLVPIPGQHPCVVIDHFLLEPEKMVEHAVAHRDQFAAANATFFPGPELPMSREFAFSLSEYFMQHVQRKIGGRRLIGTHSRLSMVTLAPDELRPPQRVCHRDGEGAKPGEGIGAAVLYLFKDTAFGGTSFYSAKKPLSEIAKLMRQAYTVSNPEFTDILGAAPAYLTGDNDYFALEETIAPAWNRAIFYDGTIFHSAHIEAPERLSDDPLSGRLTLNAFFHFRKAQGA